jgi:epoxyqueuosine reductase
MQNQENSTRLSNKEKTLDRRDFLKLSGIAAGSTVAGTLATPLKALAEGKKTVKKDLKNRDRKNRYPWWVKEVDDITLEYDRSKIKPFDLFDSTAMVHRHVDRPDFPEFIKKSPALGLTRYVGKEKMIEMVRTRWERMEKNIRENKKGYSHRDFALLFGAYSTFYASTNREPDMTAKSPYQNIAKRLELDPWTGTPDEASDMIEAAAISYGATQVRFAQVERQFLWKQGQKVPKDMKSAICMIFDWPSESDKRYPSPIGSAGNRTIAVRQQNCIWSLMNFIRGLGYKVRTYPGPQPAIHAFAGTGEIGRTNRIVSPIYGQSIYLATLITDLPVAIDKPIDFGLQEFCKDCMKCARSCPVGAVNDETDPTWDVQGKWNNPGKKAYYEKSVRCSTYLTENTTACSICMASCPWNKEEGTALHDLAKATGATVPSVSGALLALDDSFGYGVSDDPDFLADWWNLDLPPYGIDTLKGRR